MSFWAVQETRSSVKLMESTRGSMEMEKMVVRPAVMPSSGEHTVSQEIVDT